jgi:hypothetical protein
MDRGAEGRQAHGQGQKSFPVISRFPGLIRLPAWRFESLKVC